MLKKFRNRSEHRMLQQMQPSITKHGAELHEKVRVADIVDIKKLRPYSLGTYGLQSHFDFVLIDDEQKPVVAIEFDGPGHDPKNDKKKNLICAEANLPLFRVHGFDQVRDINSITLARYLVELVFHARVFMEMKEQGRIPYDEPFMLSGFLKAEARNIFDSEFDFVANANSALTSALNKYDLACDPIPHFSINRLNLKAPDQSLRAFICIGSTKGPIAGTASLRVELASYGFLADVGFILTELADFAQGMAADSLLHNIELIGQGNGHVVTSVEEVLSEIRIAASQGFKMLTGGGGTLAGGNLLGAYSDGSTEKIFS